MNEELARIMSENSTKLYEAVIEIKKENASLREELDTLNGSQKSKSENLKPDEVSPDMKQFIADRKAGKV